METSGQIHVPASLSPGKSCWYSVNKRLGEPRSRYERDDEENNPYRYREPNPVIQPVTSHFTDWAIATAYIH
jgi:hypothetical protein